MMNLRWLQNERGSTLILVVLLSLILSASAIVALRDVARSAQGASVYRTRTQAQTTSDSANRLFGDYVGNNAQAVITAMQALMYGADGFASTTTAHTGATTQAKHEALVTRGAHLDRSYLELQAELTGDPGDPDETGLFVIAAGDKTFESRRGAEWRVKIRDLTDGFPAVNYGEGFCFKKAVIAAESVVGEVDPDWSRANNVAQSRHGTDVMIGPVRCGYN